MNVLVISGIFPAPIERKKRENDILLKTAEMHQILSEDTKYFFLLVIPYSNYFLSLLSPRWKQYKDLIDIDSYNYKGHHIEVIAVPGFRKDRLLKSLFVNFGYKKYRKKIEKLILDKSIDLVHAHNVGYDAGIACKINEKLKIPYILTSRGLGVISLSPTIKKYIKNSAAVINLGLNQLKISKQINLNSVLIPHGIEDRFFDFSKQNLNEIKSPLRIVTISRLLDWKNIDKVLMVLHNLDKEFVYDIYGDGPEYDKLKTLVKSLNLRSKVTFKGYKSHEEIPGILIKYDLFVLTSYIETFGRVYLEAMACGLPIIAAKGGGIESYIQNGNEGFLVSHDNSEELREVFLKIFHDKHLLLDMGQKAKTSSKKFAWKKIIHEIDNIYRLTLKNNI